MPQFLRPDADVLVAGWRRETYEFGTAQAGGVSTITLAATANAADDFYNGWWVELMGGTGVGGLKKVLDYVGATKVATVDSAWTTAPDATTLYETTAPLFEGTDEVTPNSADYAISPLSPTSANPLRFSLSAGTDPNSLAQHVIKAKVRKDVDGGARVDLTIEIYDSSTATLIATHVETNLTSVSGVVEFDLTTLEIPNITAAGYGGALEGKLYFTEVP